MESEIQKDKIKKEAREILNKFGKALEKVPPVKKKESKEESWRKQEEGSEGDEVFRKMMLKNAPNKDDNCIIAEKAKW